MTFGMKALINRVGFKMEQHVSLMFIKKFCVKGKGDYENLNETTYVIYQ